MFAVQQPTNGTLDTLGGFGFPPTALPPGLGGFGSDGALQRVGAPGLNLTSVNLGGVPDAGAAQMLALSQQTNQLLLGMMSLLLGLMSNRSSGGSSPFASLTGGADAVSGAGGGSSVSGGGSTGSTGATGSTGGAPQVANPKVQKLMDSALSKQGAPYVFGAAGPDKFDCSGLVWYSLDQAGVELPRLSAEGDRQRFQDFPVAPEDLQPGDLLFYWSPNDRGIPKGQATHVEIYTGFGYAMGTDNEKEGARLEPVNWKTFIGAERVPDLYS